MISTTSNESKPTTTEIRTKAAELLLLVYIHGFKGTDESFGEFPERLEHMLSETIPDVTVESRVFPAYEVWIHIAQSYRTCFNNLCNRLKAIWLVVINALRTLSKKLSRRLKL